MIVQPWWKRLPSRLLEEDAALRELTRGEAAVVKSFRWLRAENGEPRISVVVDIPGDGQELEVRFPEHYPEQCPSVRPIPYGKLSSHQFGGDGVLCLELGPDNWHPQYHVSDMVRSAWKLLASEFINTVRPFAIPSRHVSDLAERVRRAKYVFIRPPGFDATIAARADTADMEYVLDVTNEIRFWPIAVPKGTAIGGVPRSVTGGTHLPARIIRLRADAPSALPNGRSGFIEFLTKFSDTPGDVVDTIFLALLVWSDGKSRCAVCLDDEVDYALDIPIEVDTGARMPETTRHALRIKRVGIVGLGSMGSKAAESLARSGIRRFVFVDGDVLLGPNLCRHAGRVRDIGLLKVHAVKNIVHEVCVDAPEIVCHNLSLATATNPDVQARILKDLAEVDILIDATADPDAFCVLAMLASDHCIPLVWGEVFGGGIGGLVASAHPSRTPCPHCVRAGILGHLSTLPPIATDRGEPYAGGEDEPLVASDADVSYIASAVTARSLGLLTEPSTSDPPCVLLGRRKGWVFDASFQSLAIDVRSDDWSCALCWTPPREADADADAAAEALFTDTPHDQNPSVT